MRRGSSNALMGLAKGPQASDNTRRKRDYLVVEGDAHH